MSLFTEKEIAYLASQRLGRLATLSASGAPHVVPVGFRYNAELDTIDIGGHNLSKSRKFRDLARDGRVAFVVDDVMPPWQPRGIEVRGRAEAIKSGGSQGGGNFVEELIRIKPTRIVGWGLDTDAYQPNGRSAEE